MQTSLPQALLATASGMQANEILRNCVHCGFCNATCPTYQLTGDESIFERMAPRTESLLRQGGNKKNNLRWLKLLADTGRLPGDAP